MQLPRLQGVAHSGALCSPPGHGLRLSVRHDASDKLAVFTEAFSHVHIQKPSFRFPFQIHILFHSLSRNVHSDSQESFTFRPTNVLQAALNLRSFVVSYRPCPLSNKCQSCVLKLNGNVPHGPHQPLKHITLSTCHHFPTL